jgi:hypothetical protein
MIVQAKAAHDLFESIGLAAAFADRDQFLLSIVHIFEILEMVEHRFAHVPGFGATGAFGELIEAFFDGGGKSDGEHAGSLCYTSIAEGTAGFRRCVRRYRVRAT